MPAILSGLATNFNWYGFIIGLALIVFWWQWEKILSSAGLQKFLNSRRYWRGLIFIFGGSLLGARLYHLWTDWPLYIQQPWWTWFALWQGGLGFLGALTGGMLGFGAWQTAERYWFKSLKNKPLIFWWKLIDTAAISLPLAQSIGRWGNLVNFEILGLPTNLPWALYVPLTSRPIGWEQIAFYHPLFLYESLALLGIAGYLHLWRLLFKKLYPLGTKIYTGWYLLAYGIIRFNLENLRLQTAPGWWRLSIAQWACLVIAGSGLYFLAQGLKITYNK